MSDKFDKLAAFEKAIAEKYGKEAIQNPKGNWDEIKEIENLLNIVLSAELFQRNLWTMFI